MKSGDSTRLDETTTGKSVCDATGDDTRRRERETGAPCVVITSSTRPWSIGRFVTLDANALVLGRDESADLRLEDKGISRRHACIQGSESGHFTITDLDSTNGTHVNGVRIRSAVLNEGDRIQIGTATVLRFARRPHLDESETRLRQALVLGSVGTWEWDAVEGGLMVGGGAEQLVGISGRNAWPGVHPEDRERLRNELTSAVVSHDPVNLEVRFQGDDDRIFWMAMRGEVLRDESGKPLRLAGALIDVTARRTVEQELRRNALMFECLDDAVLMVGLGGTIENWNASAARQFGYSPEEAIGRTPGDLLEPGVARPFMPEAEAEIARVGHWKGERRLARRGRDECLAEIVAVPLRDAEGRHLANLVVCRDVGEQRQLQAQVMLTDRLSAMGTLAAEVVHEINNPIAYIRSNLQYLRDFLTNRNEAPNGAEASEVAEVLRDLDDGVERITRLARDLKTYGRSSSEGEPPGADVARAVEYAVRVTAAQRDRRTQIVLQLSEVPPVNIGEAGLGQILVNLLINAAHATRTDAPRNEIRISSAWDREAGVVALEVSDTGTGIAPDVLPRIFEPFFTTKPVGVGTGLGLFVCSNLLKAAGGTIAAHSRPGEGTTFKLTLPPATRSYRPASETGLGK